MSDVNTKLTALADEVRELSGATKALSIDAMTTNVSDANDEVNNQTDLIAQIKGVIDTLPEAGDDGEITLQSKTVTPTTSSQIVSADSGYDGLDTVTVNAMPIATQATPSISVSSSGLITASTTQSAGYVASGTKSATEQLTTQTAKTITPSTSSQTAVASGVYTTGNITIAAIPSTYVQPTATKSTTTYTPTTSDQTIASGTYLTGVQTIKGDANLIPANIVSGKSIFGVVGSATTGDGSGNGNCEMISVNIDRFSNPLYYIDSSYSIQSAAPDTTIEALHGLILYSGAYELQGVSGDFIKTQSLPYQLLKFNSNGGVARVSMPGGGGAGD